jgi:hypothetical protein
MRESMISVYQTCRVCGIRVRAGFTNCDGCYHKIEVDAGHGSLTKGEKHE